jgi:DNA helicase HerA-like ATPase
LRHAFFALLHLSGSTLLDVSNLLRNQSDESKRIRREILDVVESEVARVFWQQDFEKYGKDDLGPPKNKLSKLLLTGTVSLMLSQPRSLFTLRQVMDDGLILLANLSTIGSEVREILGSFLLSLLHLTALGRSDVPAERRRAFHIHCDEAHRFVSGAFEDLIAETRKFGVSLTLAHQHMGQFQEHRSDAITSVGTTIIFNVNTRDAHLLTRDLRGLVEAERLISLEVGEAIARIGTEVVHLHTPAPRLIQESNSRDRIIAESRRRFCRSVAEVRAEIRRRNDRWHHPFTPLTPGAAGMEQCQEEFTYDEFD